ncbi:PREDICTED: uncharacterized protein LOC109147157 isoform X2 [Ipomoea nil]|uniref:uncharacterized protein LOC109147157 isoform X2 n=1 Tax=Ipomoea nil TaxID=35883 RepID=UPI0009008A8D|nr:PREDICTED: uncharacterized protein LOC109147157 isoform X2 [Ipomoea nil]
MDSLTNVMVSLVIGSLLCFLTMGSPSTASPLNVTLIQKACNNTADHEFCLDHLSKNPLVVSASQEPLAIAAAIAQSGLDNAERTRKYAMNKVARIPAVKTAYADCATLLGSTALQLSVAASILKNPASLTEVGSSEVASECLLTSIDGVAGCMAKLGTLKVEDQYVMVSCKQVEVYSVAADSILTDLMKVNMNNNSFDHMD